MILFFVPNKYRYGMIKFQSVSISVQDLSEAIYLPCQAISKGYNK